jgi:thermitase
VTSADVARQIVVAISGDNREAMFARLLDRLGHYAPEVVARWAIEGETEGPVNVHLVELATPPAPELIERLNAEPGVVVERNGGMASAAHPNDTLYAEQWALERMSAEPAWDCVVAAGSTPPVRVAVIDSGIAQNHQDLSTRVDPLSRGFAHGPDGSSAEDQDGHGTFLAGTIGAITDNARGIASTTWPITVKLLALKFYNPWTPLTWAHAAQAIAFAVFRHARVINASWHIGMDSQILRLHVAFAALNDVVFVAAAGNEGTNNDELPVWPASYPLPNVISVMASRKPSVNAIDNFDDRPGFSNYGPATVHIAAPGTRILSTHYYLNALPPRYRNYAGTSAAAAHVSAAAAVVRALRPGWSATHVRAHLMASVDTSPYLKCLAGGRLNLRKAFCNLS